jgi:hypothetical protein
MKNKIKYFFTFIFIILGYNTYSQVTVKVLDMTYSTNGPTVGVANCGNIDFGKNLSTDIYIAISLEKPKNHAVGTGNLYVFTQNSSTSNRIQRSSQIISDNWINSEPSVRTAIASFTMSASDFNESGGRLSIVFIHNNIEYKSCEYTITKPRVPVFDVSPGYVNISCQNQSPFTFSVKNVYNSPGTLTYKWIADGWKMNGVPVSSFTTTTNTVTLTPNQYPPSNIYVTAILDNVSIPTFRNVVVNLAPLTSTFSTISGANSMCNGVQTAEYGIDKLADIFTVSSWYTSNPLIATIGSQTGTNVIINRVSDGNFNLIAKLTNTCGQSISIGKTIRVGSKPSFSINATSVRVNNSKKLNIVSVPANVDQGITSVTWTKISGNGFIDGIGLEAIAEGGSPNSNWTVTAKITATNDCGSTDIIRTYSGSGAGNTQCKKAIVSRNNESENIFSSKIAPTCNKTASITDEKIKVNAIVYDLSGKLIKEFKNTSDFDLSDFKKGIYIMNIITSDDITRSKIVVE